MLRKLRRLSKLSLGELLVFSQLGLFAVIVRVGLTVVSLPRLIALIALFAKVRFLPVLQSHYALDQLQELVDLAARGLRPDGPCLIRSLLLFWLLKSRGKEAEILIGVNKEDGQFASHAWVESQGKILGEKELGSMQFATLLRL
jgi:hypothetical protein